ncbi:MAG: hypothetical protein S0880_05925 [Actinomycetota bacterium]|nr:hypothetical protein [Actinomycetota bacterium]
MRSLLLGWVLVRRGGRANLGRLLAMAVATALAAVAVLTVLSVPGVIRAQEERLAERSVQSPLESGSVVGDPGGPLRAATETATHEGRNLTTLAIGAKPGAPVPPWLDRLPADGEVVVSPALERLRQRDDTIRRRFPQRIVGTVDADALVAPDELVAVVGVPYDALDIHRSAVGFGPTPDGPQEGDPFSEEDRNLLIGIAAAVLAPTLVLLATGARLSARSVDRRIAALRLVGLSPLRTRLAVSAESATVALIGVAVGFGIWRVAIPLSERVGAGEVQWWAEDVHLGLGTVLAVVGGAALLAIVVTAVGSNAAVQQPLRERRLGAAPRPGPWRLVTLIVGLCGLVAAVRTVHAMSDGRWILLFLAANVTSAIGLVAVVPHLGRAAALLVGRVVPTPSGLVAARRLTYEPTAIARVVGGLLVVVFGAGIAQGVLVALDRAWDGIDHESAGLPPGSPAVISVQDARVDGDGLRTVDGVQSALSVVTLGPEAEPVRALVATCAQLKKVAAAIDGDCVDGRVQPLRYVRNDIELIGEIDRRVLEPLGRIAPDLGVDIRIGLDGSGSTTGGDVRMSPEVVPAEARASGEWFLALAPDADLDEVAADVAALAPASRLYGPPISYRGENAGTYRVLVNTVIGVAVTLGVVATGIAAVDRALERRRLSSHLAALGVPARTQRAAEALATAAPLVLGLGLAAAAAVLSGTAYLRYGDPTLRVPYTTVATIAGIGIVCAVVGSIVAAAVTATTPHPRRLRTE